MHPLTGFRLDGRRTLPSRITEGLPVIREKSLCEPGTHYGSLIVRPTGFGFPAPFWNSIRERNGWVQYAEQEQTLVILLQTILPHLLHDRIPNLRQGFGSMSRQLERQESRQEDQDENEGIHLLNCYQKRMKITSQAPNLHRRSSILIGLPKSPNSSGG
jgi:hypothetical protein